MRRMGAVTHLTKKLADRDPDAPGHATRVTELALRVAEALGVPPERLQAIRQGGPVHDIGKLTIDPAILTKPSALDPDEIEAIRTHPVAGVRLLVGIDDLRPALDCVLHHHERWDGTGYPFRLSGREIPLEARILAVADAYDAMVSERPYRVARTRAEAVVEVERCAGSQFDPAVAEVFLGLVAQRAG